MDTPRNAKGLQNLAESNGWAAEVEQPREGLYLLRMSRGGNTVAAMWAEDDGFLGGFADPYAPRWPMVRFSYPQTREVLAIAPDDFEWPEIQEEPDDERERMNWEREYLGYYLTKHPLEYVNMRQYPNVVQGDQFADLAHPGQWIEVLGLVEGAEVKKSRRSGTPWARFGISDLTGIVPCLAFGKVAQRLDNGAVVHARGKPEERDESLTLIVTKLTEVSW